MGRHDPETGNPQRISKKMDGLGGLAGPQCLPVDSSAMRLLQSTYPLRLSGCISPLYPVGRGWRMGRHGRDQSLSYLLADLESSSRPSSNPQRKAAFNASLSAALNSCLLLIRWNSSKSFRMLMTVSTGDSAVNSSSINTTVSSLCDSQFHNLQNCYKVN